MSTLDLKLPIPAIELIPHRNRMQLIDSLDAFGKDTAAGLLDVKEDNLFIDKHDRLDPLVYVELLAQLVAAHSGYEARVDESNPKTGFLVGIKDFKFFGSAGCRDTLIMQIKRDYQFDQISYVNGRILTNGKTVAEGTLKLWEQTAGMELAASMEGDMEPARNTNNVDRNANSILTNMLLNKAIAENLYRLNVAEDKLSVEGLLYFNNQFIGFDGHFPDAPLLPGILMMKTGVLIAELALGQKMQVIKILQAKFAKSIFPGQQVDVKIKLKREDQKIKINAVLMHKEETCSKFTIEGQVN